MNDYERLAALQAALPTFHTDAEADTGSYTYRYITLGQILKTVRPIVTEYGFVITRSTIEENGSLTLGTQLIDIDTGNAIASVWLPLPVSVAKYQALGSALTYARRYGLVTLLDIVVDDDTDAQGVAGDPIGDAITAHKQLFYQAAGRDKVMAAAWWKAFIEERTEHDAAQMSQGEVLHWLQDAHDSPQD